MANQNPTGSASGTLANGTQNTTYTIYETTLLQGFSDPDSDSLKLVGFWADSGELTDLGNGQWSFVPETDYSGAVVLDYVLSDGKGGDIQGTLSFNMIAANTPPTGANKTIAVNEDNSYTFASTDFGYADSENSAMASVKITSLPAAGSLNLSGAAVTLNQVIPAASLADLTFTPATHANGFATFNFTVNDGSLDSVLANTVTFDVTAVSVPATPAFIFTKNDLFTGEDGDTAIVSVTLATAPTRDVSVTFTSGDETEGTITNPTLTFTASNWSTAQAFTVVGQNDYIRDGNQIYSINATVNSNDVDYRQILIDPIGITNREDVTTANDARIPIGTVRDMPLKIYGDEIVDTNLVDTTTGLFKVTGSLNANDHLQGLDGNDTLYGGNLQDDLSGGIGNDTLYGGNDQDFLYGEEGNDLLYGEQDADYLDGGAGNDTLDGGLGLDTLIGGAGNDTYYLGYDAVDVIDDQGLATDVDTIIMPYQLTSYTLPNSIENGAIAAGTATSSLTGNDSNNTLTGNDGKNTLDGAVGRDSLFGGAGNDALLGGDDNDTLSGGSGADQLEGGNGNDSVDAGAGNDEIVGGSGAGDDIYIGGLGIDTIKYTSAITGITVDLATGSASGNEINDDSLSARPQIT